MRKLKKLIRQPGVFFRDYLNKRYPVRNAEQRTTESDEPVIIDNTLYLAELENSINLPPIKVDVVFTWVNNQDPKWQQRRRQHSPTAEQNALHNNDEARFSNHNELYYSLHSVRTFLPWINHIYIITDNQRPDWLNPADYPNVSIIDHSQIIDPQYLPTFNSHVIEAHLHNIPNLNEHFIYFNDDVFVARPLPKEHFFHANGIASLFIADKSLKQMSERGPTHPLFPPQKTVSHYYNSTTTATSTVRWYTPISHCIKAAFNLLGSTTVLRLKPFYPTVSVLTTISTLPPSSYLG